MDDYDLWTRIGCARQNSYTYKQVTDVPNLWQKSMEASGVGYMGWQ